MKAIKDNREAIDKLLADNKSYDGYIAMTVASVEEEIQKVRDDYFMPDVICLGYLLRQAINFDNNIDIADCFVYDYDCDNPDCNNEKENYENELCEKCFAEDNKD